MASTSRFFQSFDPGQIQKGCYIDCRFETDMKLLLGKIDRMEALIEKVVEVMYVSQMKSGSAAAEEDPLDSVKQTIEDRKPLMGDTYVYRDVKPVVIQESIDDETDHSYTNVEQYQIEEEMVQDVDEDSYDMKEDQDEIQIQHLIVPRAVTEINGISLPVTTLEDLRALDLILSEHPAMGRELVSRCY